MAETKETATKQEIILMLVDNDHFVRVEDEANVPEGARLFKNPEDINKGFNMDEADSLTSKILKAQVGKSRNKEEAVQRLWMAGMAQSAAPPLPPETPKKGKGAGSGTPRVSDKKYTVLYDLDNPGTAEEKFSKLAPQAKTLVELMFKNSSSTKKEFSEKELRDIVEQAHQKHEFRTEQPPWRIFQYYRRKLEDNKMIKIT